MCASSRSITDVFHCVSIPLWNRNIISTFLLWSSNSYRASLCAKARHGQVFKGQWCWYTLLPTCRPMFAM